MLKNPKDILYWESLHNFIDFNFIYFSLSSQDDSKIVLCVFFPLHNWFPFLFEAIILVNAGKTVNKIVDTFYLVVINIYLYS